MLQNEKGDVMVREAGVAKPPIANEGTKKGRDKGPVRRNSGRSVWYAERERKLKPRRKEKKAGAEQAREAGLGISLI